MTDPNSADSLPEWPVRRRRGTHEIVSGAAYLPFLSVERKKLQKSSRVAAFSRVIPFFVLNKAVYQATRTYFIETS